MVEVISTLGYYNERARKEEIAKYTSPKLEDLAADDPDAVFVAYAHEEPIGFCISRYDDGLIWLSWFGVKNGHRRVGVGTALLRAMIGTVRRRQCHKVWCDSRTSNKESEIVLGQAGFRKICEVKNHWYGQDFFLWERSL